MDHPDKRKQTLEILGLESLEGLSLADLSDAMAKSLPSDVSKKRILNVYVIWLHSRLMAVDTSTGDFTHEITAWYRFLKLADNDDLIIAEAFGDWQREQATENPTSLRRLSIAKAELNRLMTAPPSEPAPIPHSAEAEVGHGQMHPDRVKLSQATPTVIDLDDYDSDIVMLSSNTLPRGRSSPQDHGREKQPDLPFLTGSNTMPLTEKARVRSDKPLLSGANMLALDETERAASNTNINSARREARREEKRGKSMLLSTESRAHEHKERKVVASKFSGSNMLALNKTTKAPSDLSFLTGSNKMVLNETAGAPPNKKLVVARPQERPGKPMPLSFEPRAHDHKGEEDGVSKKPREGYTCRRCGKPGHPLQKCPTNMDPSFDMKPPKDYKCPFCKKVGDHFMMLCLRNPDPNSVGRRRQEDRTARGRTKSGRPTEYRDGSRRDPSPHFYDDRRSRFDGPARGRGRSRSPAREAWDYDRLDRYVPAVDFSRLSISRKDRAKRKATRSPSPHTIVPRKKNTPWIKKDVWPKKDPKNWSTWKPTRPDDLISGRRDQEEGRLSYDDEVDRDAQAAPLSSPAPRTVRSPSVEMIEVERPEASVPKMTKESAPFIKDQALEHAALDMIRAESVKTDLLLFIDGVEHLPPLNPFLTQLFKGQESFWANKTLKKTRPCPTDFFEFLVEDEDTESTDCEMVDEMDTIEDGGQTPMHAREEAVDSAMMLVEPVTTTTTAENGDEEMLDVVLAAVPTIEASPVGTPTGSFSVEELNEAQNDKAETGDIEILASDGYLAERVGQEAAPAMVHEEPDQSDAPAETRAEVIVIPSSPPAHTIDVEMTPMAPKNSPGCGTL